MTTIPEYICPICASDLVPNNKQLRCQHNHSFDFAKEGYVNLLPVQLKKSLNPGDDKNMVLARREFLASGHYQFLRDHIIEVLKRHTTDTLVDLGCGEGYYTNEIQTQFSDAMVYGIDISKSAVKYAAKRNVQVHYSVGTISHLPFKDNTTDVILNVFAPLVAEECKRILHPNGIVVRVSPAAKHLWQLKQYIYDTPQPHESPKPLNGFELTERIEIKQATKITGHDAEQLLLMTPFGWKITEQNRQRLKAQNEIEIEFEFLIDVLQ